MSSTATAPPPTAPHRHHYQLQVNSYDRASSLLVSLLIMVGVVVAGLVIIYFASRLFLSQVAIPVQTVASRPADAALGLARDIEPPGLEDAPDLVDPQLQDTLNALTESLNASAALLSDEVIDNAAEVGKGSGLGDSRAAGTGGEGDASREPAREFRYKPASPAEYAEMLDYFKIELGVLSPQDNKIYYAYNLRKSQPDTRVGDPATSGLHSTSSGTPIEVLDRQLAQKAGIASRGAILLQFYPPETEQIILQVEQQRAGNRTLDQIKRSVFRVQRQGSGFAFSVESQEYF